MAEILTEQNYCSSKLLNKLKSCITNQRKCKSLVRSSEYELSLTPEMYTISHSKNMDLFSGNLRK